MIKVDRSKTLAPDVLKKPDKSGLDERTQAINFYTTLLSGTQPPAAPARGGKTKKKKTSFDFEAYRAPEVVKAMEALFRGKCAYCESYYAHIHPADREHWRPKSEVILDEEGKIKRYGYYWLGSEWNNLLPSCIDCNRVRTHFDFVKKKEVPIGKGNWFPLEDENKRASLPDEEGAEAPLLINPCEDRPELYLKFNEEGVVRPVLDKNKKPNKKAESSIRVYALNREELVKERAKKILEIQQKLQSIRDFVRIRIVLLQNGLPVDDIDKSIKREREQLEKFKNPEEPYSLMAKQVIAVLERQFKKELESE